MPDTRITKKTGGPGVVKPRNAVKVPSSDSIEFDAKGQPNESHTKRELQMYLRSKECVFKSSDKKATLQEIAKDARLREVLGKKYWAYRCLNSLIAFIGAFAPIFGTTSKVSVYFDSTSRKQVEQITVPNVETARLIVKQFKQLFCTGDRKFADRNGKQLFSISHNANQIPASSKAPVHVKISYNNNAISQFIGSSSIPVEVFFRDIHRVGIFNGANSKDGFVGGIVGLMVESSLNAWNNEMKHATMMRLSSFIAWHLNVTGFYKIHETRPSMKAGNIQQILREEGILYEEKSKSGGDRLFLHRGKLVQLISSGFGQLKISAPRKYDAKKRSQPVKRPLRPKLDSSDIEQRLWDNILVAANEGRARILWKKSSDKKGRTSRDINAVTINATPGLLACVKPHKLVRGLLPVALTQKKGYVVSLYPDYLSFMHGVRNTVRDEDCPNIGFLNTTPHRLLVTDADRVFKAILPEIDTQLPHETVTVTGEEITEDLSARTLKGGFSGINAAHLGCRILNWTNGPIEESSIPAFNPERLPPKDKGDKPRVDKKGRKARKSRR